MKKILSIFIILALVVAVSGCVEDGVFRFDFGEDEKEKPSDLIDFQNTFIIPSPPISAGEEFTFSTEAINLDDIQSVDAIEVNMYDTGLCRITSEDNPLSTSSEIYDGILVPEQVEFIEWGIRAPTNQQIGHLSAKCPLRYKLNYDFTAQTQLDSAVINYGKLVQLERAGESASFSPSETRGRGPIKILMDHGADNPVRTDSTMPIFIKIQDKGSGLLDTDDGSIPIGAITLKVPIELSYEEIYHVNDEGEITGGMPLYDICNGYFSGGEVEDREGEWPNILQIYTNSRKIPLINRESPQIRCSFKTPNEEVVSDEKTYYFSAEMNYSYAIDEITEVSIEPTSQQ
jgi:hypothetical protein